MTEDTQNENIELTQRSEEVQDVLTYIPSWVIRWGISVIFLAIVSLLAISCIVKYPEVVSSRIILTSDSPAHKFVARASGPLLLMLGDGDTVTKGQYMLAIQNPVHTREVMAIRERLEAFRSSLFEPLQWSLAIFPRDVELGELQTAYNDFLQKLLEYSAFKESRIHEQKIEALETQIGHHRELGEKLASQKELIGKDTEAARSDVVANRDLLAKKVIARNQLMTVENRLHDFERSMVEAEKSIIGNQIQLDEFASQVLELTKDLEEKERALQKAVRDAYNLLVSNLTLWEEQYVMKAPIAGQVSFLQVLIDNHFVKAGDELLAVVPAERRGEITGRLRLTEHGAGKIKPGSVVRIRLDSYPYRDFGTLEGRIESISGVSSAQSYFANVSLPRGTTTSYGKSIDFRDGMEGDADVVAYDLRLILHVFNYLRYVFDR